jgi:hypothetical protein
MDEYLIDRVQEVGRAKQIKAGGQLGVAGPSILKSIDPPPAPILQLEVDGAEFFDKFLHRIAWVTVCPPCASLRAFRKSMS